MPFTTFDSWEQLLEHIEQSRSLYYHAPMDYRPSIVVVKKVFKNGKLQVVACGGHVSFTADHSHLPRFKRSTRDEQPN